MPYILKIHSKETGLHQLLSVAISVTAVLLAEATKSTSITIDLSVFPASQNLGEARSTQQSLD